jgi:hypothetical protein
MIAGCVVSEEDVKQSLPEDDTHSRFGSALFVSECSRVQAVLFAADVEELC